MTSIPVHKNLDQLADPLTGSPGFRLNGPRKTPSKAPTMSPTKNSNNIAKAPSKAPTKNSNNKTNKD